MKGNNTEETHQQITESLRKNICSFIPPSFLLAQFGNILWDGNTTGKQEHEMLKKQQKFWG